MSAAKKKKADQVKAYILKSQKAPRGKSVDSEIVELRKATLMSPTGKSKRESLEKQKLVAPPFDPVSLVKWTTMSTWHYRCCGQKAEDVAGLGWKLREKEEGEGKPADYDRLMEFFTNCNPTHALREVLYMAQFDYEAVGWLAIEVVRTLDGLPAELHYVPAHEIRVHQDEPLYAQMQNGEARVWFKALGVEEEYTRDKGKKKEKLGLKERANELIFITGHYPLSSYYGMPAAIPALRALVGDVYAREYNLDFFSNHAIPAYAVIVEGGSLTDEVLKEITAYFKQIKKDAHQTLVLSTPTGVKIRLDKLNDQTREGSFERYETGNRQEIIAAHNVPPYRVGLIEQGSLGGNVARETTEIYKNSVVKPRQEVLEKRMNLLIAAFDIEGWEFKFDEIDTRDEKLDSEISKAYHGMGVLNSNEVRQRLGREPYDGGDRFYVPSSAMEASDPSEGEVEKQVDGIMRGDE